MEESTKRILVPTDLSEESFSAFEYAVALAAEYNSEIILAHVVEPLPRGIGHWEDISEALERRAEAARDKLEDFHQQAVALYPRCRSELHFGPAPQVIRDLAAKLKVDLIVTSARPRHGILDRLLGGLPETLVRLASCPVLAVRPSSAPHGSPHPRPLVTATVPASI